MSKEPTETELLRSYRAKHKEIQLIIFASVGGGIAMAYQERYAKLSTELAEIEAKLVAKGVVNDEHRKI